MDCRIWPHETVLISKTQEEEVLLRKLYELIPDDEKQRKIHPEYGFLPCGFYEKGEFPEFEEFVCLGFFAEDNS